MKIRWPFMLRRTYYREIRDIAIFAAKINEAYIRLRDSAVAEAKFERSRNVPLRRVLAEARITLRLLEDAYEKDPYVRLPVAELMGRRFGKDLCLKDAVYAAIESAKKEAGR